VVINGQLERLRVGAKNAARQLYAAEQLPYPTNADGLPIVPIVLAGVGVLVAVGGGAALGYAELTLGDVAAKRDVKDASMIVGYVGVAGLAVGTALIAAGGVSWLLSE
jgi:hypothetical protein